MRYLTGLDGVYALLDHHHTLFLGRKTSAVAYADAVPGDQRSAIVEKARWDKPQEIEGFFVGLNMTPDGRLVMSTDHGWLVSLKRDFSSYEAVLLPGATEQAAGHCARMESERGNTAYGWVRTSLCCDEAGGIYIADWRNDRIQKFDSSGNFISSLGTTGDKEGEFNRPTDIAVDKEGLQYVADWDNDRVQIFDQHGDFITMLTGDATLSKWAETKLDANPDMRLQREIAQGLERERLFRGPIGIEVDDENRLFVVDSQRNRVQIYRKIDPTFVGLYDGGRL